MEEGICMMASTLWTTQMSFLSPSTTALGLSASWCTERGVERSRGTTVFRFAVDQWSWVAVDTCDCNSVGVAGGTYCRWIAWNNWRCDYGHVLYATDSHSKWMARDIIMCVSVSLYVCTSLDPRPCTLLLSLPALMPCTIRTSDWPSSGSSRTLPSLGVTQRLWPYLDRVQVPYQWHCTWQPIAVKACKGVVYVHCTHTFWGYLRTLQHSLMS